MAQNWSICARLRARSPDGGCAAGVATLLAVPLVVFPGPVERVWDFGTRMGSIPESGPSPVRTGICRRPLPWCGVAMEDLKQEGVGTVFCVTCMPRRCVSGKTGSIEH